MIFQQEYLGRHNIVLPEVHHTLGKGSLVLRTDSPSCDLASRWIMVSLEWMESDRHPGYYEIVVKKPVHDGCSKEMWSSVAGYPPQLSLQYEEIEPFFVEFARSHGKIVPALGSPDLPLANWEIFLYTYDGYLASKASVRLRDQIEQSIDPAIPDYGRYRSCLRAVDILMDELPQAFEGYSRNIHAHTQKSLAWLARLVNGA